MNLSKLYSTGLAVALLLGASAPMVAHATDSDVAITIDDSTSVSMDSTQNANPPGRVIFHVANPTSSTYNFVAPDLGVTGVFYVVPAKSERTFALQQSVVGYENRNISYHTERHPDPLPLGPQYADWARRLADLIAAQRVDYSYFPQYKMN